jgi:DNA-binding MarR family transcriptional regulator
MCYGCVVHTSNSPDTDEQRIASALIAVMTGLKVQMSRAGHDFAPAFVLYRVAEQEPVRVSDLAVCCGLDPSTVSRHVKTLEDQQLVARTVDPEDRRASRVGLTDEGRAYIATLTTARAQLLSDALADWPVDDRRQFLRLTQRLAASLAQPPISTSSEPS